MKENLEHQAQHHTDDYHESVKLSTERPGVLRLSSVPDVVAHIVVIIPEAESVHVGLDLPAGEVFTAVAVALLQLVRPSLPPEDVD